MEDSRDFLNKIRSMKESGKHIGLTESKDITFKTGGNLSNEHLKPIRLNENEETIVSDAGEEGQDISPDEQREEENAFKGKVSQLVEFNKIKVFKKTVTWSGKLIREGIKWSYTLDENFRIT